MEGERKGLLAQKVRGKEGETMFGEITQRSMYWAINKTEEDM